MEKNRKKKIWPFVVLAVITLLALILSAVLLLGGTDADWQEQYDLGRRYLEEGNYEEAILAFSAAIEIDPKRPEAYLARGDAYMELGDYESAMEDYERAQRRDPDNEEIGEKIKELEERIEEQEQAQKGNKKLIRILYENPDEGCNEEWNFTYNAAGQMIRADHDVRFAENGNAYRVTYRMTYDEDGHLIQYEEDRNDYFLEEVYYYTDGLLTRETFQDGSKTTDWGNAWEYTHVYDGQGRRLSSSGGPDGAFHTEYTYDDAGQLVQVQEIQYSMGDSIYSSSETTYAYDAEGRVAETVVQTSYYDGSVSGPNVCTYDYTYHLVTLCREANGGANAASGTRFILVDSPWNYSMLDGVSRIVSSEAEDGYLTKVTGSDCTYEFIYEEVPEEPEEAAEATQPQQTMSRDSAEYEVQRVDDSYYDGNGVMRLEKYYDQIVLQGNEREYAAINAAIQAQRDVFFANWTDEDMESVLPSMYDEQFFIDTAVATVTHNADGIFSFYMTTAWYMGGVFNADHYGQTYDLTTGEALDLPTCFGMSETELVTAMKDNAWAYLSANCYDAMFEDARETLYAYQLADFNYYIEDGQLILTFPTYILSYGAAGPLTAPTGIYIP